MAGIMLPSLQKGTGTKAQHSSKATHSHPSQQFAELFKAKAQETTEARKNNQPARTAPAEGPKQEQGKHKAAVDTLVLVAPFCVAPQPPASQVAGGERADAVAAAVKSAVHPKTSTLALADKHIPAGDKGKASPLVDSQDLPGQTAKTALPAATAGVLHAERSSAVHTKPGAADLFGTQAAAASASQSGGLQAQIREAEHKSEASSRKPGAVPAQESAKPNHTQSAMPQAAASLSAQPAAHQTQGLGLNITPSGPVTPAGQVAALLIRTARDGSAKAEMQLHPESLGSVQVKLQVDPQGGLQAVVVADQAAVQMLASGGDQLRDALLAAGIQLVDLQLQTRSEDSSADSRQSGDSAIVSGSLSVGLQDSDHPLSTQTVSALIQGGLNLDLHI